MMCNEKCTCGFRLFHLNASMTEGGAMNSVTGVPPGRGRRKANTKEDTMAAYLGNSTNRGALPDELRNDEVELGFAEDADLKVRMPSQHIRHIVRATWFQNTPARSSPPQVVQLLSRTTGSPLESRDAWSMVMRQLNEKVKKTGTLFKDTAAEGAKHFSRRAFTALSPAMQDAHSWTCDVCPDSERARTVFGTAVLKDNARGAARADPPLRVPYALVPSVGRTRSRAGDYARRRTLCILRVTLSIMKSPRATQLCKSPL